MKKYFLFSFVLLLSIKVDMLAQLSVSGKVIDSQTKSPIESVYIQNRNRPEKTAMADDNGYFSISGNPFDTLDFIRIGYDYKYIICENENSIQVELIPKEYDLSEVTITNEDAYELVRKAFINLKSQYLNVPATYLWHGSLYDVNKEEKNESYALYSARFNKNKSEKDEISFDLNLIDLGHLSNNFQTSKNEGLMVNMHYHSFLLDWPKLPKDYKLIRINSENDSLIMVKCIPLLKSKSVPLEIDIIINKSDTILLYYHTLLYNEYEKEVKLLGAKIGTVKLLEKDVTVIAKKSKTGYQLDNIHYNSLISATSKYLKEGFKYKYKSSTVFLDNGQMQGSQGIKLNGEVKQLYKMKPTTTEQFWEKYKNRF